MVKSGKDIRLFFGFEPSDEAILRARVNLSPWWDILEDLGFRDHTIYGPSSVCECCPLRFEKDCGKAWEGCHLRDEEEADFEGGGEDG